MIQTEEDAIGTDVTENEKKECKHQSHASHGTTSNTTSKTTNRTNKSTKSTCSKTISNTISKTKQQSISKAATNATNKKVINRMLSTVPSPLTAANVYDVLQCLARNHNFTIRDVPGNGNCFFHAVSISLPTAGIQQLSGPDIRTRLVHFLNNNEFAQEYAQFVPAPRQSRLRAAHTTGKEVSLVKQENSR